MKLRKTLIMLLVSLLLISLTACKTVLVVPVIIEPDVQEAPTHEPWQFTAIDSSNFLISEEDLQELTKYIVNLKDYGSTGWDWVQYYINELDRIGETFKE